MPTVAITTTLLGTTSTAGFVVSMGADGSALADGTAYSLDVSANTAGGEGAMTDDIPCTPVASELTASFQAQNVSTSETDLSWDPTYAADLYVSTDGVTFSLLAPDVSGGSYHATDLQDGQTYYFRAGAIIPPLSAATSFTAPVTASTDYTITSLTATPTSTASIALSWATLSDVTRLDIYRSVDGGPYDFLTDSTVSSSLTPTSTSYTDNTVQEGHDYSYQLQAVVTQTSGGEALTQVSEPADAQTMLVTTSAYGPASTGYALQWTQLPLVGDTISSAAIYRAGSEDGTFGFLASVDPAATSFTDTSASAGSAYWYEVVYTGAHGNYTSARIGPGTSDGSLATLIATSDQSMSGVLADFIGPFADTSAGDYAAVITTGDGTTVAGTVASDGNGGFLVSGAYNYTTPALDSLAISLYTDGADVGDIVEMVNVKDGGPTVTTAASATLSSGGTTATLDVTADDPAGEDDLSYTWATTGTPPAAVTFDDNGDNDASEVEATFTATGTYEFQVTITDSAGLSTTSSVSLDVTQIGSDVEVTPDTPTITAGQSEQLTATEYDQFDQPMATQPSYTWQMVSCAGNSYDTLGSITSTGGLYTSDIRDDGTIQFNVTASDGQEGSGNVQVTPVLQLSNVTATGAWSASADFTTPIGMTCYLEAEAPSGNFATVGGASGSGTIGLSIPNYQTGLTYQYRLAGFVNGNVIYSNTVSYTSPTPGSPTTVTWNASYYPCPDDATELEYGSSSNVVEYENPSQSGQWQPLSSFTTDPYGPYTPGVFTGDSLTVRVLIPQFDSTSGAYSLVSLEETGPASAWSTLTAPQNVQVTPNSDGTATISWDAVDGETAIVSSGNPTSMGARQTITGNSSIVPGGQVSIVWFTDGSAYSPVISVQPPAPSTTPPVAPTNVNATAFDDSDNSADTTGLGFDVSWVDQSTNETGFQIWRSDTSSTSGYTQVGTVGTDVQSYVDTSVPQGSSHYYKVTAVTANGNADSSPYSVIVPGQPQNLSVTSDGSGGLNLTWTGIAYADYEIQWSTSVSSSSFVTIDTSTTATYDDTDPNVGSANNYRIVAYTQSNPNQVALEGPASADASDQPIEAPVAVDYVNGQENASGGDAPFVSQNGKPVIVPASQGVLSQDFDPGGRTMTAEVEDTPDNGTVTVNSDGSFTYTPNNGFVGTDTFSYAVTNSADRYSTGTVAVDCYDPAPTAKSALYKLDNTGSVSTPAHTLDGDVVNPAGGSLSYRVATGGAPQHGTVTFNPDGSFAYTARSGFHGWDHFSYIANNGNADSNVAQVTLAPPNSPQPSESARAISQEASTEGVRASYNEAWSRLQALKMASLKYKEDVATFAASSNPNDEDGMNLVIADGDAMQTLFNSYMNQYNAVIRLVGEYTKTAFFWQIDAELVKDVNALPGDPFQIKLSQKQAEDFTSAAQAEGDGVGYWLDNTTNTIKTLETTHTVLTIISAVGGISAVGQKLIVSGLEVAAEQGACAAAQAIAKEVAINVAAGVTVNAVVQSATSKLANMLGLSPSTVQIIGDTFQLVCLLNAWRLERLAANVGCFTGETIVKVETATGVIDEAIDEIHIGQRVDVSVNDGNDPGAPPAASNGATAVDPATWREVDFTMADAQNPGDSYTMRLLEPAGWIAANRAAAGDQVNLDLPELEVHGPAMVTAIKACPAIDTGVGDVVLGTFQHVGTDVVNVSLQGESAPLSVTAGHLLWSLTRGGWAAAGSLRPGEELAGENGPVTVDSVTAASTEEVYNLDVETDHRYLVTNDGIVAHNADPFCVPTEIQDVEQAIGQDPSDMGIGVYDESTGRVYLKPMSEVPGGHAELAGELGLQQSNCKGFTIVKDSGRLVVVNNSHLNGVQGLPNSLKMDTSTFQKILGALRSAGLP